ncbi:MAG: pyridoxal phosphate-dependent aminotransferase [Bacteroidota bacterium]
MHALSRKIQSIEESQTLALTAKARRLKEAGVDVISLTAGEPDFPTPRHVKEAAIKAIEADFTHYTANQGTPDLIQAIVKKFATENKIHFEPGQILVSSGAKQSIFNALQAICNKGDEVIVISPYWVSYPEMVKLVDAVPVIVRTSIETRFKPDLRAIRRVINQKTKAIIINSPGNPTGAVYSQSEFEDLARIVKETGIYVISDEIYEKVMYDERRHFSIGSGKGMHDHVITVNGVSKAYAMTGWRIGYMGGPLPIIEAAAKVQSQVTSNANSIAQKATIAALNGPTADIDKMVEQFGLRRDCAMTALRSIPGVVAEQPEGAFYIFFQVKNFYGRKFKQQLIKNSADMSQYLLDNFHVATVPGYAFGDDTCVRISYACSLSEIEKGTKRIKEGLTALQ